MAAGLSPTWQRPVATLARRLWLHAGFQCVRREKPVLIDILLFILACAGIVWAVAAFHLTGEDLSPFDRITGERFSTGPEPSAEHKAVVASFAGIADALRGVPRRRHTAVLRDWLDNAFADRSFDASFTPVDCAGVPGEWVLAPGADSAAAHALHPWRRVHHRQPEEPPHADEPLLRA